MEAPAPGCSSSIVPASTTVAKRPRLHIACMSSRTFKHRNRSVEKTTATTQLCPLRRMHKVPSRACTLLAQSSSLLAPSIARAVLNVLLSFIPHLESICMDPKKLIEVMGAGVSRSRELLQPSHLIGQSHTQLAKAKIGNAAGSAEEQNVTPESIRRHHKYFASRVVRGYSQFRRKRCFQPQPWSRFPERLTGCYILSSLCRSYFGDPALSPHILEMVSDMSEADETP